MINYAQTSDHFVSTSSGNLQMPSMHYHNSYELYYLEEGSRDYFVDDKLFSVSAGNFVLIPPLKFHRTGGSYARRTLVGFTHEFLEKTFTTDAVISILKCFDNLIIMPPDDMQADLKLLLNSIKNCTIENEFALHLGLLLTELSKCNTVTPYNTYMGKILEYINANSGDIYSIEQISNNFYISKFHLCRIFKNAVGITVIDYLNNIKIKNACELLRIPDMPIIEISQHCGFNSSAYFCNVFRRITGVSPSEYRKELLKK